MTPNARFTELIKDINPSPTTIGNSKAAHEAVRKALRADETYRDILVHDFLGGSYSRDTAIRPRTKNGKVDRPDIDIYAVISGGTWFNSPKNRIDDLYAALDRARRSGDLAITNMTRNRCSISLSLPQADIDVSPLLERQDDGYYRIGNKDTGDWYRTDPERHTEWSTHQNDRFGGRFKSIVKLQKWARRENPTLHRHPKSFSQEAIMAVHAPDHLTHYGEIMHAAFTSFVDHHSFSRVVGICPSIQDPAIPDGNLLAGVSGEAFCAFYDKMKAHRDHADAALSTDDQDKGTSHWRQIFGPRFPTPVSGATNVKSAVRMSPLAFPDAAAAPGRKPAKFA